MCDYIVLELVQANYQTYLVFTDREDGTFRGAYHYQREIKSGFIFLNGEGPEEVSGLNEQQIKAAFKQHAQKAKSPSD